MPRWFDRAEQEIEQSHERGDITDREYHSQMSDLCAELQGAAEEAAEQSYNDTYGNF